MREALESLCREAGQTILKFYPPDKVNIKGDGSPVTAADIAAHEVILKGLSSLSSYPVVSEEDFDSSNYPPAESFWLVDPLDGTKDFINQTGEFTVNIALIRSGRPVAGFIYVPCLDETFSAWDGVVYKNNQKLRCKPPNVSLVAATSHFHKSQQVEKYLGEKGVAVSRAIGSSYKLCLLAEGEIDLYPRFSPTSHWDIAAGQAIVEAAGCKMSTWDQMAITYDKLPIINPHFLACKHALYGQLIAS